MSFEAGVEICNEFINAGTITGMPKTKKKPVAPTVSQIIKACVVVAVAIFVGFGWLWWHRVYNNPQRAFWGMLRNSLNTTNVTRHVTQTSQDGSLEQIIQLNLGSPTTVRSATTLKQPSMNGNNTVRTENIGTPTTDYARYVSIDTKELSPNGRPLNFSGVLNVWGKSEPDPNNPDSNGQLLSQTVFGLVPFGRLSSNDRLQLLKIMSDQNVYSVDYKSVTAKRENGRAVYVYNVTIKPDAYMIMLKQFAQDLGMNQLASVDPSQYAGSQAQTFTFTIDKLSRQLLDIGYADGSRSEAYSGFGLQIPVKLPQKTISITDLQNRLQQLQ